MSGAPPVADGPRPPGLEHHDEEMPRLGLTPRRTAAFAFFVVASIGLLYFVLPRLAGLSETWDRLGDGDPWWLGIAFVLETLALLSYGWLFHTVFVRGHDRISWGATYEITLSGVVATRLFAAGGAGGIALQAWAVRRAGMEPRVVACRMVAFLGLQYAVYMLALVVFGLGLRVGLFNGPAPFAFTVLPALLGVAAFIIAGLIALLPADVERRLERWARPGGRFAHLVARLATVPASAASGVRTAIGLIRRREVGVLAAVLWWTFDIATLWAAFNAFGEAPPLAVLVLGYYVGLLANLLPLPGGIGGVDGGMIGTFIAFDVSGGLAVVAVLVYRGFSFWLPIVPGAIAYLRLRRTVHGWREAAAPAHA